MERGSELEALFARHGYTDFRWIDPKQIVVAQWVRMKCMYGCDDYGRKASCPPNVPTVAECRQFLNEYRTAVIFHVEKRSPDAEERRTWAKEMAREMVALERDVFLAGHPKAFVLPMVCCRLCADCASLREECKQPELARPTAEAMAIDVFSTVRGVGYPIEVLTDYGQTMNRYAVLMIE